MPLPMTRDRPASSPPAPLPARWGVRRTLLHAGLFATLVAAIGLHFAPRVVGVEALAPQRGRVVLPFSWAGPSTWEFAGTIRVGATPLRHLTVRADDCVTRVAVDDIVLLDAPCRGEGHWTPTRIPLPDLDPGVPHRVSVQVSNSVGLTMFALRQAVGPGHRTLLLVLIAGLGWLVVVRRTGRGAGEFWIGAGAILLGMLLHAGADPWLRQHDIGGHREYVEWLLTKGTIPPVLHGWETFQPPLYYVAAAGAHRLWEAVTPEDPARGIQALALAAYVATVLLAALFGTRRGSAVGLLPAALVALLPAHLFLASRISNDVPLALLGGLATVLLVRGAEEGSRRVLLLAGLAIAAAVATKVSSMALVGAGGAFALLVGGGGGKRWGARFGDAALVALPGGAAVLALVVRSIVEAGVPFYTQTDRLPDNQVVPNTFWKFFSFDAVAVVVERAFDYGSGAVRDSLATSLAVTAAGGDEPLGWLGIPLLPFLVPSFLGVVLLVAVGLVVPPGRRPADLAPWLMGCAVLAFLWLYNFTSPWSSCQNARLLAPAFVPLALVAARGESILLNRTDRPVVRGFIRLLPIPFLLLSASVFLRLAFW